MTLPKMILFDYGQTLVNEAGFGGIEGTAAVLKHATKNKYNLTASPVIPNHEFEFIIATSGYLFRKPNKRIFQLALEKADLKPEEVWYIGDNYACDVRGARNAGIFPVWYIGVIDLPYEEKEDVLTVHSWAELQKVMSECSM